MNKIEILLLLLISFITFILVFTPHLTNHLPVHIDEWQHIEQALRLKNGDFFFGNNSRELGFQFILIGLSFFFNLMNIYQFLPAIFAVISSLTLFFIVKKMTKDNTKSFFISLFAMIFFMSIKSNVNLLGLWFFTPLTFSIPFIFLYIYLFDQGIQKNNKKYLISSLIIMIFLIFVHALSVLFAIPMLAIFCLINYKKIKQNYKIFLWFLLIPIIGLLFYFFILKNNGSILNLLNELQFKKGWGVVEINNSPFELYSLIGYFLASLGIVFILLKKQIKKYLIYILWPLTIILSIIFYKLTDISLFSPYQRNLYYLSISLPFLSALGLFFIFDFIKLKINLIKIKEKNKIVLIKFLQIMIILIVIFFTFNFYFNLPNEVKLYKLIDNNDIQALNFLSYQQEGIVMAPIQISNTVYVLSNKNPVANVNFYGNRKPVDDFFSSDNCKNKNFILNSTYTNYVLSKNKIECNWSLIYQNGDYIYKIK
jgi:hypothetical protein